jgi:hypothetical protein
MNHNITIKAFKATKKYANMQNMCIFAAKYIQIPYD